MSEADISIRARAGVPGVSVPADSDAYPSQAGIATPSLTTPATPSISVLSVLHRVFSFPAMLATFLVGAVFVAGRAFLVDPDLWWHIKTGEVILSTHRWPTTDPYSFTVAGQPWLAREWLGDMLFATVTRLAGLQGLDVLLIALGSCVMLALYAYMTVRSGNSKAGFVGATVLLVLASASFSLRPQMLGYLFIILTLIALERFRQGYAGALWFLPPLFLLWINIHGSWVIGLGVIAVFLLCGLKEFRLGAIEAQRWSPRERIRLEFTFLLCLAAIPFTPYGTQLAAYPFTVASSLPVNMANILEWQPMPFDLIGGKLFLALVLGFFVCQMATRFSCRLEELALFVGAVVMASLHVRFLLLFVPLFAPLFVTILARWVPRYEPSKDRWALNAVLMAIVVVCMVRYFPSRTDLEQIVAKHFPVRAVEYMRQHRVPGPLFNTYGAGGYLIWALPEQKVFIDGRGDLFEDGGAFSQYIESTNLRPAAFAVLRAYRIQSCLLQRTEPLATVLAANPDWEQRYSDEASALFVRRSTAALQDAGPRQGAPSRKE
jgi:hypothetical protein